MQRFAPVVGSLFLAVSQANAELIINGQRVDTTTLPSAASSPSNFPAKNNFQNCVPTLRSPAVSRGVGVASYDRYTQKLTPDYSVIERLNYQPELSTPIWDYLSGLVDEERVHLGRQKLQQHR